jgi:hypothetical protein
MTEKNPSNPYTSDPHHTSKEIQMPISRARVVDAKGMPEGDGFHTVRIKMYGDESTFLAPVLTPMAGSVWVPQKDSDVAVIFTQQDKPWVIGSWYALDRVESGDQLLPDYNVGDLRLGNHTGSHATIHNDGHITIATEGTHPINIDTQSAVVSRNTDQVISGSDTYNTIEWNSVEDGSVKLYNDTEYQYELLHDGKYNVSSTIEVESAGQNNLYTLALLRNEDVVKRVSRQSTVNEPLSISVSMTKILDADDTISVALRQDSGSNKTLNGNDVTNDFVINREGI